MVDSTSLSDFDRNQIVSFLSASEGYTPQSGQIFGILKQMKEDFDVDLGEEQASEKKAVEEFEALKSSKMAEIDTAKATIVQYDQDLAELGEQNAGHEGIGGHSRAIGIGSDFPCDHGKEMCRKR